MLKVTRSPKQLRDYCTKYHCELHNITAHPIYKFQGRTPYKWVVGRTPDISKYIDYQWYETIWYLDRDADFPNDKRKLGKLPGIAHNVGQAIYYYVLNSSGKPVVRSTITSLSKDELQSAEIQQAIRVLDLVIGDKLAHINDYTYIPPDLDETDDEYLPYDPVESEAEQIEVDTYTPEAFDNLILAEVLLPQGDTLVPAKVISRKHDHDGSPIGTVNSNPILDT